VSEVFPLPSARFAPAPDSHGKPSKRQAMSSNYQPMRVLVDYSNFNKTNRAQFDFAKNSLMPTLQSWLQSVLSVKRNTVPIYIEPTCAIAWSNGKCQKMVDEYCGLGKLPSNYFATHEVCPVNSTTVRGLRSLSFINSHMINPLILCSVKHAGVSGLILPILLFLQATSMTIIFVLLAELLPMPTPASCRLLMTDLLWDSSTFVLNI
jgi:hypothetical protein